MILTRRSFALGVAALTVAGCSGPAAQVSQSTSALPPDLLPAANPAYDTWLAAFRPRARSRGITDATLNAAFRGAGFLPGVVTRDRNQTEFRRTLEDYLSIAVSDERVALGRAAFATHRGTLLALQDRYGTDPHILTAIWGLESFFGTRQGQIPVISATSTLAFEGRRGRYFESELMAALDILQNGHIPANRMTGSWAGAMGHTQFMPTVFQRFAVDFTGDGRRDIWSDDPRDALASAANFVSHNGWRRGLRWGGTEGTVSGTRVIQPQPGGPRFAVTENFNVIRRYNPSDSYALGVGLLADRIAGAPPHDFAFPPDANGLTKADRIALQQRLTARGFDTGGADGVIGKRTEAAISGFQAQQGLPVTGRPSRDLLRALGL